MNCAPHLGFFLFVCFQTYGAIMRIAEHPPLLIRGHFTFNRIVKLCILGSLTVNVMWQSCGHTCDTLPYDTIRQSHVTVTFAYMTRTRQPCDGHLWLSHVTSLWQSYIDSYDWHVHTCDCQVWHSRACTCDLHVTFTSLSPVLHECTLSQVWLATNDQISHGAYAPALLLSPIRCSAVIATGCIRFSEQRTKGSTRSSIVCFWLPFAWHQLNRSVGEHLADDWMWLHFLNQQPAFTADCPTRVI